MKWHPKKEGFKRDPDFIVEYEWNPDEEVKMVKRYQGLRSDFLYEGDNPETDYVHAIYPEFLDEQGKVIENERTEAPKKGYANMWIMYEEQRPYHKQRIREGVVGYFVAGSRKLAKATVIQVGSLREV